MRRVFKILIGIVAGLFLLVAGAWFALTSYVRAHKQEVLAMITRKVEEKTSGSVTIKDLHPVFWKNFPGVSVALDEVTLTDSLFAHHHHPLARLGKVYARVNIWKLLHKQVVVTKLTAADGTIYLYTDKTGYTNLSLFAKQPGDTAQAKTPIECRRFVFERIRFILDQQQKHKWFGLYVYNALGSANEQSHSWTLKTKTKVRVAGLGFNTATGYFLRNATITANLDAVYHKDSGTVRVERQKIHIDDYPVYLTAGFIMGEEPYYSLRFEADKAPYANVRGWLSENIDAKLKQITLRKPVAVTADLSGRLRPRDTPVVNVRWAVRNDVLATPFISLNQCSFDGGFSNYVATGRGHGDRNSMIRLIRVHALWRDLPMNADSFRVDDLVDPLLRCSIYSAFALEKLNHVSTRAPFLFRAGTLDFRLAYSGGVKPTDIKTASMHGNMFVRNGDLVYKQRGLGLKKVNANLAFNGEDLFLKDVTVQCGSTMLAMDGNAMNFVRFYFSSPEKVAVNWNIRSRAIDLNDFIPFLRKGQPVVATADTRAPGKPEPSAEGIVAQLDQVVYRASVHAQLRADRLFYRKFNATGVYANGTLSDRSIEVIQAELNTADGKIGLKGNVYQLRADNPFVSTAQIDHVSVRKLFSEFGNFGQTAIGAENLQGSVTATANIQGNISERGRLNGNTLKGQVKFQLANGALLRFEPLERIGGYVGRRRNMSNVTFKEISNTFTVDGNRIYIPLMTISSSILSVDVQGVYSRKKGETDLSIGVPLRNPERNNFNPVDQFIPNWAKHGPTVRLRARDDAQGRMHIGWDPLRRGGKLPDESFTKK